MLLLEKIVKLLSQLSEMFSNLEKNSLNVKCFIIILEDLHNLLNESTYKGDKSEVELRVDENGNDEGFFVVEDYISSNLKYSIEKEIDSCFEACQHIYQKYTSSILKKTLHYIKIFLFDNPEDVLSQKNNILLQRVLNVRLELKEKNFAILYEDINQTRAQQQYNNSKNKRISNQDLMHNFQKPQQNMNTVYNLKNKNNQSGGDIIDQRSAEYQLSFETPLPPDAADQFNKLGQILKQDSSSHSNNFFVNQNKKSEGDGIQRSERKEAPDTIKYKLEPLTHISLQQHDTNHLQEIAICKIINFTEGVSIDKMCTYKDFYTFKRGQYTDLLANKLQDLGRISRNHACLRAKVNKTDNLVSFYLVNLSPNGCSILKNGSNEWTKVKDQGQEYQIFENDTIGILFDSVSSDLLIGYKFELN